MVENKTTISKVWGVIAVALIVVACLVSLIPYLWTALSGFKYRTDILSTGEASPWTIPIFMGGCLITSCSINIGRWYKKKRKEGMK